MKHALVKDWRIIESSLRLSRRTINFFDQSHASPRFTTIAHGRAIFFDAADEVFKDGLMTLKVGHDRRCFVNRRWRGWR